MIELSYSRIATAKGCWQKYKWKYIDGYEPIRKPISLTLGKIIHEAFELYYGGKTDAECLQHIVESYDKELQDAELADHEDLTIAKYTAMAMWSNYPHKRLDDFESISPEQSFRIRLSPGVYLNGRVDGVVKKDGKLWVREVKTTGLDEKQMAGRIRTSGQATTYVFAIRSQATQVEGVMYDVIRKPRLRKKKMETTDQLCKRIMDEYRWFPDQYYTRHWEYRNDDEIRIFQADMVKFAVELRRRNRKQDWYRNTDQCWNFNSECPYLKICFSDVPDPLTVSLFYTKGGDNDGKKGGLNGGGNGTD